MSQRVVATGPLRPRCLRMEALERRDLLSVKLLPGTETFKSFEFVAAQPLSIDGTWTVHQPQHYAVPFEGATTRFHGTATYTSHARGTVVVDTIAARGTWSTPLPQYGGSFTLADGGVRGNEVRGSLRKGRLTGDLNIKLTNGSDVANLGLSGRISGVFDGPNRTLDLRYRKGDLALHVEGDIRPRSAGPFGVLVNNAVWTAAGLEAEVAVTGGVHKASDKRAYNIPVGYVQLYWAKGTDFVQRISALGDKLPIYWNQASGKYSVTRLPSPPPQATHLLFVPEYDHRQGTAFPLALPPRPGLAIGDVQVLEGLEGTTSAMFPVTLAAAMPFRVTVSYQTVIVKGQDTTNPRDFRAAKGTVTFAPGQTQKTIRILVNGDAKVEPDETFTVRLTRPSWATLTEPTGVGTIQNDDLAPALDAAFRTWSAADAGPDLASH